MAKHIYFDYAASTPMDPRVLAVMKPYFTKNFYNPSAIYLSARGVREDINEARKTIAGHLGVRPAEIIFTAGATEANNLAVQGVMNNNQNAEILVSAIEHDSVLAPAKRFSYKIIPVNNKGIVDTKKLKTLISSKTALVSVMLVNNEIGTVQPVAEIASIIKDERTRRLKASIKRPIYLHTDLAQAGNFFDLHLARLGVDLATINGGKIYGPKQSGALYIRAGVELEPLIVGGGQEQNMRSGTENVPAIIGLAKAFDIAQNIHEIEAKRITTLRMKLEQELAKHFPEAIINGDNRHKAPHIISLTLPGVDNERLMMELDEQGIEIAVGSACSASSDEPSPVLKAIGLSHEQARSTVRLSLGRFTGARETRRLIKLFKATHSTSTTTS